MSIILSQTVAMALNAIINATIKQFFSNIDGMSEAELADFIVKQEAEIAELDARLDDH